jgi:hypothetical protein
MKGVIKDCQDTNFKNPECNIIMECENCPEEKKKMMIFSIGFNYQEDPLSLARPMLSIFEDLCGKLLNQAYPQLLYLEFLSMNSL